MADESVYAKFASQKKAKKAMARALREQTQRRQNKRAQRYLGLRQSTSTGLRKPLELENSLPTEVPQERLSSSPPRTAILFVCVDVECYERDHSKITEIGISQLDAEGLQDPGEDGKNWLSRMKHEHLRISDYEYLRNGNYVNDNADRFQFGESQWLTLTEAKARVNEALQSKSRNGTIQKVVLVGHNIKSDIRYLRKIGCDITDGDSVIDVLDTEIMYRALRDGPDNIALSSLCYNLNIDAWCLHNAGNDAAYTLQCFVLMTLKSSKGEIGVLKPQPDTEESDGGEGAVTVE